MKKTKLRGTKGITLIALVVTIVVLLILAGVSIAMLTGEDGIIKQAQRAKEENEIAEEKEKINLAMSGARARSNLGEITIDNLTAELDNLIGVDKYTLEEKGEGQYTVKFKDSEREYTVEAKSKEPEEIEAGKRYDDDDGTKVKVGDDIVTIPGGATVSKIPGEYEDVDKGIVIYIIPEEDAQEVDWESETEKNPDLLDVQEKYSQFVWVPVPNAIAYDTNNDETIDESDINAMIAKGEYPMAIKLADGNYKGILYNFTETTEETTKVTIEPMDYTTSFLIEPAYLTDSTYGDANKGYNNVGIEEGTLQTEFNTMVERVKSNGGFWVGRYETSNMSATDDNQEIEVVKGATDGVSDPSIKFDGTGITWYRMYAQQKHYKEAAGISMTSSMIWGSQWDQIMIWMKDVENKSQNSFYVVNSIGMGNFNGKSRVPTGFYEVKHIYDLAGNVAEWTLEAYSTDRRVNRGGFYYYGDSSRTRADLREDNDPNYAYTFYGSRPSLY